MLICIAFYLQRLERVTGQKRSGLISVICAFVADDFVGSSLWRNTR
jgi:hypothetical protein